MTKLDELKRHLKKGKVYRRDELARHSTSVDRHLGMLLKDGTLRKLSQGLYYYPKETAFGAPPPEEEMMIKSFLKDDRFLLTSPNAYNSLGVGTTQLYNKRIVYNHKRHGDFKLGNRNFSFRIKPHFPNKLTPEFLVVDLVNNLWTLAEDPSEVMRQVSDKVSTMDRKKLARSVSAYGNVKTRKLLSSMVQPLSD
jgi:hypothetical protein